MAEVVKQNSLSVQELKSWKKEHPDVFFQLHVISQRRPSEKNTAGATVGAKTGMDQRNPALCSKLAVKHWYYDFIGRGHHHGQKTILPK